MDEAPAAVALDQLTIQKPGVELPLTGALAEGRHPIAEMGGERVKVELETVAGKSWQMLRCQDLDERMDNGVRGGLRPRTQLKNRDQLGWGVEGDPHPKMLHTLAGFGANLGELNLKQIQVTKEALM